MKKEPEYEDDGLSPEDAPSSQLLTFFLFLKWSFPRPLCSGVAAISNREIHVK